MEMVTEADEAGVHTELAQGYNASALKKQTDAELEGYFRQPARQPSSANLGADLAAAEMSVKRATVTPWWWGIKTLLQVGGPQQCQWKD